MAAARPRARAGELTHLDREGAVRMVDVGPKPPMHREAAATGFIRLAPATANLARSNRLAKGSVLAAARIAAIQAAKKTSELIPLCHHLPLDHVGVEFSFQPNGIRIEATARTTARTGVEMEALTAVSVAALTLYDMCKSVDKSMSIEDVRLVSKTKTPVSPA